MTGTYHTLWIRHLCFCPYPPERNVANHPSRRNFIHLLGIAHLDLFALWRRLCDFIIVGSLNNIQHERFAKADSRLLTSDVIQT
jgi:hypothetical protein